VKDYLVRFGQGNAHVKVDQLRLQCKVPGDEMNKGSLGLVWPDLVKTSPYQSLCHKILRL
jgi:hypothetical protein